MLLLLEMIESEAAAIVGFPHPKKAASLALLFCSRVSGYTSPPPTAKASHWLHKHHIRTSTEIEED